MAEDIIENKIVNSGLITLDLADYYPKGERKSIDIAPWLFEGIMLREKDFRQSVKDHDWSQYRDCYVAVFCSEDAIIPQWAYMLLSSSLAAYAKKVVFGTREQMENILMDNAIAALDLSELEDQRVIIKGCGDLPIPPHAYVSIVSKLQPLAKSIMFGEACSTVPIFKKKR